MADGYAIIRADLGSAAAAFRRPLFDLVFLDPPYDTDAAVVADAVARRLAPGGLLIVEHARRTRCPGAHPYASSARARWCQATARSSFYASQR